MHCQKLNTYMETGRVVFLPVSAITPNPDQPRRVFSQEALQTLAESIREHGILQPLSVRRVGTAYQLVAGERRLRAAMLAGLKEIPCILMRMDDRESGVTALVENIQRQDLDYIEQARAMSALMAKFGYSQEQVAQSVGLSQSAVANKLRLLRHSVPVLEAARKEGLTERHARALLKLPQETQKLSAIAEIARRSMSVAQTEKYIENLLHPAQKPAPKINFQTFFHSLSQSVQHFQQSGIAVVSERKETDKQIVLTITIPKA